MLLTLDRAAAEVERDRSKKTRKREREREKGGNLRCGTGETKEAASNFDVSRMGNFLSTRNRRFHEPRLSWSTQVGDHIGHATESANSTTETEREALCVTDAPLCATFGSG